MNAVNHMRREKIGAAAVERSTVTPLTETVHKYICMLGNQFSSFFFSSNISFVKILRDV